MDQLINYTLHLADSNLILTQRNAAWCGHGPILEQDIAITNITLDLIGQSRNLYQYAATLINKNNVKLLGSEAPSPPEKGFLHADSGTFSRLGGRPSWMHGNTPGSRIRAGAVVHGAALPLGFGGSGWHRGRRRAAW